MNRREYLRHLILSGFTFLFNPFQTMIHRFQNPVREIPRRVLGRTQEKVSILGLGGFHLGQVSDEKEAIKMIQRAIDTGINFIDTAESYQNGGSEERIGKALRGYRQQVFLMTKTFEPTHRDAEGARRHLEGSLRRLQTDYLDLWQLHSIQSPEDVNRAFREGGTMEYILKAKKEGKVRFIGVTGHRDPESHLHAIKYWDQGWQFDTMQMPINPVDYHQLSFQRQVLPELVKRNIGVIAMKTSADGRLLREKLCTIQECLYYVWSLPVSLAVVGMRTWQEVYHNMELARNFQPMKEVEQNKLLSRLKPHAQKSLEWYKR